MSQMEMTVSHDLKIAMLGATIQVTKDVRARYWERDVYTLTEDVRLMVGLREDGVTVRGVTVTVRVTRRDPSNPAQRRMVDHETREYTLVDGTFVSGA